MKTATFSFSALSAMHEKQVATLCPGIKLDQTGRLSLGQHSSIGVGCRGYLLQSFDQNPPRTTRTGTADDIFPFHAGGRVLLASPNKMTDSYLVLIRTKAGRFETRNGGTQTLHGRVVKHAQGIGRYEHATYEDCIVELGYHASLQVTGTDGSKWVINHTGVDVKLMSLPEYEAQFADELAQDEPARELVAA